uniref:Uncharacterized protein n=1 Tax=Anopheles melas TaxID=34690 RepID=A0A182TK57_9DIPT
MARGVDDRHVILGRFELPQRDIDGDTTLTLRLQLVQHPGVLERALAHFLRLLLELLDRTLVDTAALVDQMAGGGRLAGVDVTDDDDVNMTRKELAEVVVKENSTRSALWMTLMRKDLMMMMMMTCGGE